jgi:PTS system nitrogen regulatory IIA component
MKIKQILSKNCVVSQLRATTKEGVIDELSDLLGRNFPEIGKEETARILVEREKLGSTGIGNGVAIPHGKLSTLSQIVTGFGRSLEGISFDSQDGKPAHLFFVLLAPENAASLHLKALARLSRLLKDVHFRNKLMEAKDETQIYNEIVSEDEKF